MENLTGLQFLMQQVIEQLILTDRKAYLKEQLNATDRLGCKETDSTEARYKETDSTEARYKETDPTEAKYKETDSTGANCKEIELYKVELIDVFDDLISPRNTVIYARKNR